MTVRLRTARRAEFTAAGVEMAAEHPDGPGHVRVEALFGDLHHAERVSWMLGDAVEVLAPAALREALATRAAAMVALYSLAAVPGEDPGRYQGKDPGTSRCRGGRPAAGSTAWNSRPTSPPAPPPPAPPPRAAQPLPAPSA